ncbi:MAG: InlB B-repeat-containing protein [bacterium]|nr:InlB B-repeat-containing protein [bacterium]
MGWNTQADGNGTNYTQGVTFFMGAADVTLYANWTNVPTYSVIYSGNGNEGGSVPVDTTNYMAGQSAAVLGNPGSLLKTGEYFVGWNTQANGEGTTHAEGANIPMGSNNVTLYAKWGYLVGDVGPAGGHIFFVKDEYSDGWRYLEAAPASTEWTDLAWGGYNTRLGGTSAEVGTGKANTEFIVNALGIGGNYAALACYLLVVNGYNDWFLPSYGDIYWMRFNLHEKGIGGFQPARTTGALRATAAARTL